MGRSSGGRDWDEVVGSALELVDAGYAIALLTGLGGLLGLGAARLLQIQGWVGATAGALLLPLLVILLVRAASREGDRQ